MNTLPIRELIMYKNGVSFFVREGTVEGRDVRLVFKTHDINDVLKSLTVFDRNGGTIASMSYQTPRDPAEQSAFDLSDDESLQDIVRDLRGREVMLAFLEDGKARTMGGFVIGTETKLGISRLLFMGQDGLIRFIPVNDLRTLKIVDAQTTRDLAFFLDNSRREESRCIVNLHMSEGQHQLVAFYIAPSPMWRVSYRIIAQADKEGSGGRATLQGWGIFDNRLEEDLENVRLTFVAGSPISFVYDLYTSPTPKRATLSDPEPAPPPVPMLMGKRAARAGMVFDEGSVPDAEIAAPRLSALSSEAVAQSFHPETVTQDTGDVFQYQVTTPISVKRGDSALVPILAIGVQYERQLLYNPDKHGKHPLIVLAFENTSALTLDRGPVTVVEDGVYRGETMLEFTKPNQKLYLPFSLEQAVVARRHTRRTSEFVSLRFDRSTLIENYYDVETHSILVENKTDTAQTIIVEVSSAPLRDGYELFDTPEPEATVDVWRWRVPVPNKGVSEWQYKLRRLRHTHVQTNALNHTFFEKYLTERCVDSKTQEQLLRLMELYRQRETLDAHLKRLRDERNDVYQQQAQWRENLNALRQGAADERLRARFLKQLDDSEDRLETIQRAARTAENKRDAADKQIEKMLQELS